MKKPLVVCPLLLLLIFMLVSFGFSHPGKKQIRNENSNRAVAVVELFTSEGCSSCPAADEAVAALAHDYPNDALVLGFHVDYWNYLGWTDAFSSASYSKRQEEYAAAFSLNSIYTPQIVVNGKYQFTGSDKSKLYSTVENELKNDSAPIGELTATGAGKKINVRCAGKGDRNTILCMALVQLQASTTVQSGENKGRQLRHINVVRDFIVQDSDNSAGSLRLPADLEAKDCKVVVFLQNKINLHIAGASVCAIQ